MADSVAKADEVRDRILAEPDMVLEDPAVMRALIEANEKGLGSNVVDLRSIAMERLEARLDRLEETHRSVIAAAYENLAGTNQVHRAILRLLEPIGFDAFLDALSTDVRDILKLDSLRLVLETSDGAGAEGLEEAAHVLDVMPVGFAKTYVTNGRDVPLRKVTLRQIAPETNVLHGDSGAWIRSEACLCLDFGAERLPGLLVLGSEDPHQFAPSHGTDLLTFFAGAFERAMRRWLA